MRIKTQLHRHCLDYSTKHIAILQKAIASAQDSANSESKSTAGDKHETGRAMAQLQTETLGARLEDAVAQHALLERIDAARPCDRVEAGAVVETTLGWFYIAISADEIEIGGEEYCPISLGSPVAQALKGLGNGETGTFRGQSVQVLSLE